jgi:peptidoglycan/xylan/chitin deacetylase (PgdA/CDA1 family)
MHISGGAYADNDHVAFATDLGVITKAGFRIAPLHELARISRENPDALNGRKVVALTCDDGPDFDFHDLPHPSWGTQRSMLNILADFRARAPAAQPDLFLTSFVIVSPEARAALDVTCMIGKGWWNDAWWPGAIASGLMGIANHSWDHNHESLPAEGRAARGTFRNIADRELADRQIRRAGEYLRTHAPNPSAGLFAYPYGESNGYLSGEYFPAWGEAMGMSAAFDTRAQPWTAECSRWEIPRYVFGHDWKDAAGLERILQESARKVFASPGQ